MEQVLTHRSSAAAGLDGDAGTFRAEARPLGSEDKLFRWVRALALAGTLQVLPDSAANNDVFCK
ncbi:hypothetical protein [Streptomyces sp. NPDC048392]|uniref:hypothetical protein n=1 Tax=Streptomyces sp. NPDC048392 TaxID=3365543 RepID=UPI0037232BE1